MKRSRTNSWFVRIPMKKDAIIILHTEYLPTLVQHEDWPYYSYNTRAFFFFADVRAQLLRTRAAESVPPMKIMVSIICSVFSNIFSLFAYMGARH